MKQEKDSIFILPIRYRLTYTIDQDRCIFQEMSDLCLSCLFCKLLSILELVIDLFYWKSNIILLTVFVVVNLREAINTITRDSLSVWSKGRNLHDNFERCAVDLGEPA